MKNFNNLIDTGLPVETPDFEKKPDEMLYMGEKVADFKTALKNIGYEPNDIIKVILTHKHQSQLKIYFPGECFK